MEISIQSSQHKEIIIKSKILMQQNIGHNFAEKERGYRYGKTASGTRLSCLKSAPFYVSC